MTPNTDLFPPILHSDEYEQPVPLSGAVNTSGGEDSPFILPDGEPLYFFFTPDVRVPTEEQLFDGVTGVYVSHLTDGAWGVAERVWLEPPDILSLDGAVTIQGDEMWFASVREGLTGMSMFTAEWLDGRWQNWQPVNSRLRDEIQVGEAHLYGNDLYFHSYRPGGKGDMDIWMTTREGRHLVRPCEHRSSQHGCFGGLALHHPRRAGAVVHPPVSGSGSYLPLKMDRGRMGRTRTDPFPVRRRAGCG